jgi:predicted metal-dependent enzyme (double-stranded beta helix superfamily)
MPSERVAARHWPWPDSLDALTAAPRHHTLMFENDRVRVLDTRIAPGETTPVHTHRWPGVLHVLGWGDFVRRDGSGVVLVDSRASGATTETPTVLWSAPLPPHSLENVGRAEIHVISVELKDEGA